MYTNEEDSQIYPKLLCSNCKRKLDSLKSAPKFIKDAPDFSSPDFSCVLCIREKERSQALHLKECDIQLSI